MNLGFLKSLRKKPRPAWLEELSDEERKNLARNLRRMLDPKSVKEHRPSGSAPRGGAGSR